MKQEVTLGLSAFYHDSAACLFIDKKIVAACEEERFTGIKHDDAFPTNSINWLVSTYNVDKIDKIIWYEDPDLKLSRQNTYNRLNRFRSFKHLFRYVTTKYDFNVENFIRKKLNFDGEFITVDHHLSHAAFSYLTSPYQESAIVSIDGVGEWETLTISKGNGTSIEKLYSINYPNSLGLFYSAMTSFLGFKPNEGEYKVMGLAPYGRKNIYYHRLLKALSFDKQEIFHCNSEYFCWTYDNKVMFTEKLVDLLRIEPRFSNEPLEQCHKDIAKAVQLIYEEVFNRVIFTAKQLTNSSNLCLGGGCAYNGVANSQAYKYFHNIHIPFSPSDSGSCIGAVLYHYKKRQNTTPFLGPSDNVSKELLDRFSDKISYKKCKYRELLSKTASLINSGKVVGWFQDQMEFGARALGNRSILASPIEPEMKSRINKVIKKRESFRPFAPSCIEEKASEYFDIEEPVPFMNQVVQVRDKYKDKFPAITHVDNSARVQTVNRSFNRKYYDLLRELEKQNGYPMVLNTSFNFKDQTITLNCKMAIERFLDCDMDFLILNDYIITKRNNNE